MIIQNLPPKQRRGNGHYLNITETGDSAAYHIPEQYNRQYGGMSVMLTDISGVAEMQFTLDPDPENVINGTAKWHSWCHGEVSDDTGMSVDSPVAYIKFVGTGYTAEVLV